MPRPHRSSHWLRAFAHTLLLALVAAPLAAANSAERGKLPVQIIPLRAEEAIRRMFGLAIDARGRVFAANGELLVYDGYRTQKLPLPSPAPVGAVAVDSAGRVWTGSSDALGFFAPQPTGGWAYTSIRSHLPAAARDYDRLWEIHCLGATVFFVTSQHLLVWREGKFTVHSFPNQRRLFASTVGRTCYVWQREKAPDSATNFVTLWKFDESGRAEAIPHVNYGIVPPIRVLGEDGSGIDVVLNTARRKRLRDGELVPALPREKEADQFVVITADLLPRGDTLMGTNVSGIYRFSPAGEIRWHATVTTKELPDNAVEALALDRHGRAWVIAPNALCALDTTGLVTTWPSEEGWPSAINTIARVQGKLLVGDAMGLHRIEPAAEGAVAHLVPQLDTLVQSILDSPQLGLVTAGQNRNRVHGPNGQDLPPEPNVHSSGRSVLHLPGDDHVLIFAELQGLSARQDPATLSSPPPGRPIWPPVWQRPFPSLDRVYGGGAGELFVSNATGEVTRFQLTRQGDRVVESAPAQLCTPDGGIGRIVNAQQWGERFYLFTREAVWTKAHASERFARVATAPLAETRPFALTPSTAGDAWAVAELRAPWRDPASPPVYGFYRVQIRPDGALSGFDAAPVAVLENVGLLTAQFREPGVWWLGGTGGLARIDLAQLESRAPVRLLDPPYFTTGTGEKGEPLELAAPVALRDARRLRVEFAFSRHMHPLPIRLESRLVPTESTWTGHTDDARWRDLAGLPAGDYALEVRTVDLAGQASPAIAWPFAVAPRFSETWWYRAGIGLVALAAFAVGASVWTWRLRRRRDELASQVAERTTALVEANQELHRLNARRAEFIGVISHELRTPLLGATLLAEQLARQPDAPDDARRIHQCLADLQLMLDGSMDLSRYELGLIPVRLSWVPLDEPLASIVDLFRPLAEAKGVALHGSSAAPVARTVLLDLPNFRRIAANLLSNAVKYTATGEVRIELRLDATPDGAESVHVSVQDTGTGMSAEQVAGLFADFQRTAWRAPDQDSHGLGLALTKRLVDLAGGSIACESTPERGSTFTVNLPVLSRVADATEPPFELEVLVVEDERSHAEHAQDVLEPLGATVHTLERLAALAPDRLPSEVALVILDFNLPDGTGLEALTRLQGRWRTPPRWVLVSAIRSPAMIELCRAAGFDAILPKPMSVGDAIQQVRAACARPAPRSQ